MFIISSRKGFAEFFHNKKIAILVFNKDSRNLLRFVNEKLEVTPFEIKYLIDLTLDYRFSVNKMTVDLIDQTKIIRNSRDLEDCLSKDKIDVLLCFERRYGSSCLPVPVKDFDKCYSLLKSDYDDYFKNGGAKAEFNFRWRMDVIDYINCRAVNKKIFVVSSFWEDLYPYNNQPLREKEIIPVPCSTTFVSVQILELVQPLYNLDNALRDAKVRFILGSDWGVGKTSFLLTKMKGPNGDFGISEDAWFALASEYFVPSGLSTYSAKGYIVNEIFNCWTKNPNKDIYVKFGGRLEEYVYGIPTDQRLMLDDLPRYFRNSKFDIVLKPDQTENDIKDILADLKRYYSLTDDKIYLHNMDYDGFEINP